MQRQLKPLEFKKQLSHPLASLGFFSDLMIFCRSRDLLLVSLSSAGLSFSCSSVGVLTPQALVTERLARTNARRPAASRSKRTGNQQEIRRREETRRPTGDKQLMGSWPAAGRRPARGKRPIEEQWGTNKLRDQEENGSPAGDSRRQQETSRRPEGLKIRMPGNQQAHKRTGTHRCVQAHTSVQRPMALIS